MSSPFKFRSRLYWRSNRISNNRLTIVSQFYPPDFAPTGQLLADLASFCARKGLQLNILTGMPAYAYSSPDASTLQFDPNICIRRTRASRLWPTRIRGRVANGLLFCLRIFLRLLRSSRRGDLLLYTSEPPYLPFLGLLVSFFTRTPYIILLYDLYPDVLVDLGVLPPTHPIVRTWRFFNSLLFKSCDQIIVLSDPMLRRLAASHPMSLSKVSVLPSWADPEFIVPRPKTDNWFVAKHRLESKFTVLYSGNQGRCHDLVTILAAALLLRDSPDILFLIIGNGPQRSRIEALIRDWDLDNCLLLPYQDYDDIPYSLASADVALVTIGITSEGVVAPSKLYGHLSCATPVGVISPPNSYLRRVVEDSSCGRWFANGDAVNLKNWIIDLKSDPEYRNGLGRSGRELLLRTASRDLICGLYYDLFLSLLSKAE